MKQTGEHILLISYVFPPYPGIGGRRWAKFAKYLAKKGFVVHVICAQNPTAETSIFIDDVKQEGIHVYPVSSGYPSVLIKQINSFTDKINYRIQLMRLKLATKSNYYDKGINWKSRFISKAKDVIEAHRIKNIVVTGAPFSVLFDASALRQYFPGAKMIADMRDPWTWGTAYGMQIISAGRKAEERRREAVVIEKYDIVSVPTQEMKETLCKTYPSFSDKIQVIPHAFDPEEINLLPKTTSPTNRFVFYGTLYVGIENVFEQVLQFVLKQKSTLDIFLFGNKDKQTFFKKDEMPGIHLFEPVQPSVLFKRFSNYDYVIIIQPVVAKDFITTKIFEIIYSGTPIILISEEGKLSSFIVENKLGIHIHPGQLEKFLAIDKTKNGSVDVQAFPIASYSFESVTDKLVSYFD